MNADLSPKIVDKFMFSSNIFFVAQDILLLDFPRNSPCFVETYVFADDAGALWAVETQVAEAHAENESLDGESGVISSACDQMRCGSDRLCEFQALQPRINDRFAGILEILTVFGGWLPAALAPQAHHIRALPHASRRILLRCVGEVRFHVDISF